jgi:soluble lytic murein transglycosylase
MRISATGAAEFTTSSVFHAALLLYEAGERDLSERFLTHLTESLSRHEAGMLGDFALELGTRMSRSGSPSARRRTGTRSCAPTIPITDLAEGDWPIDPALALSIARRESEFDPGVISHAGAMGLMQVMPGTGRDTAAELEIEYDRIACWAIRTTTRFWRPSYIAG